METLGNNGFHFDQKIHMQYQKQSGNYKDKECIDRKVFWVDILGDLQDKSDKDLSEMAVDPALGRGKDQMTFCVLSSMMFVCSMLFDGQPWF